MVSNTKTNREASKASVVERVSQFSSHFAEYTHTSYNETEVRVDFVNPFFKALGWDVDNEAGMPQHLREVTHEATVIVSVFPTKRDSCTLSALFSSPTIMAENSSDEFVRIFYVACSRAVENLYVHVASGCTRQDIENALLSFVSKTQMDIQYKFIE